MTMVAFGRAQRRVACRGRRPHVSMMCQSTPIKPFLENGPAVRPANDPGPSFRRRDRPSSQPTARLVRFAKSYLAGGGGVGSCSCAFVDVAAFLTNPWRAHRHSSRELDKPHKTPMSLAHLWPLNDTKSQSRNLDVLVA